MLSLFRNFAEGRNFRFERREDAYTLSNMMNFANPESNYGTAGFGWAIRTLGGIGGRQFQVEARPPS